MMEICIKKEPLISIKPHVLLEKKLRTVKLWSVNIAEELKEYLKALSEYDESIRNKATRLNFAEAGLLVHGSAQLYCKKVESLYCLAHHALSGIRIYKTKTHDEKETESVKKNSVGLNSANKLKFDMEIFSTVENLIKEGKNINLDENIEKKNITSFIYEPSPVILSYVNCDSEEKNKCANCLPKYTILTTSGSLIIDGINGVSTKCQFQLAIDLPRKSPVTNDFSADNNEIMSIINNSKRNILFDISNDDVILDGTDKNNFGIDIDIKQHDYIINNESSWQMLDAYQQGGLPLKSLKRQKITHYKKNNQDTCLVSKFRFIEKIDDSFDQSLMNKIKNRSLSEIYNKIQLGFDGKYRVFSQKKNSKSYEQDYSQKYSIEGLDIFDKNEENEYDKKQFLFVSTETKHQDLTKEKEKRASSFEKSDIVANITQSRLQLVNWRDSIESSLINQQRRNFFDLNQQCEKLINKLSDVNSNTTSDSTTVNSFKPKKFNNQEISLRNLCKGKPVWEQARDFVALLHLINNGSVGLRIGEEKTLLEDHKLSLHQDEKITSFGNLMKTNCADDNSIYFVLKTSEID